MSSRSNWFDLWGFIDGDESSGWSVNSVKTFETDLLDASLSPGARLCKLWIRYVACHDRISEYSKARLAADFDVNKATVARWISELHEGGYLKEFSHAWLQQCDTSGQVYFIRAGVDGPIKIGTAANSHQRLLELQTGSPEELTILGIISHGGMELERQLHTKFSEYRIRGEWFMASEELLEFIRLTNDSGKRLPGELKGP